MANRTPTRPTWPLRINPYSAHANGLVGCWSAWADRAGAVWDDLSGRGNTGTVTLEGGDVSYQPVLRPSAFGRALQFAGVVAGPKVGYVSLANVVSVLPMSVTVWFRPDATTVNNMLFWTGETTAWTGHYLNAGSDGNLNAVTANSGSFAVSGGVAYVANQWQHAAGVWLSDSYRRAYINGAGDTADTTSKTPSSFAISRFGAGWTLSYTALVGSMAEVRLYKRALQPAEVMAMYHPASRWDLYSQPRRYYYVPDFTTAGTVGLYGKRGAVALPGGVRIKAVQ